MAELYDGDEDIEILCFLLDRKYLYEKSNMLKALRGTGRNVFHLSSSKIPDHFLESYREHS